MTLERKILDRLEDSSGLPPWRPELFDLSREADRRALEDLVDSGRVVATHDTLVSQIEELIATRRAAEKLSAADLAVLVREHVGAASLFEYGTWVHYPWLRRLVHVLPEREYRELRHARNQYKIKPEEQAILAGKSLGVVGLSVGQATAIALAQEGVGRVFRLADYDTLSLSNMNRLRASVASVGVPKVAIAAREMFEIDPYLDISIWPQGLSEENVDTFLLGGGKLDFLVEECDDLFLKMFVRERARAHRIPVGMDTNERGMMDVERFDLEPERPILHGLLSGIEARDVKRLTTREKVPYVLRILGQDTFSPRFVPSLMEIDQTIKSWPQLASGVALGAALVTDVARRVLLDQFRGSGRYFVDIGAIIREGAEVPLTAPEPLSAPFSPLTAATPVLEIPAVRGAPTQDDLRRLVEHGLMAPSGGNVQPWRYVARSTPGGATVRAYVDTTQHPTLLDFERGATHLAHGAAALNIELAAQAAGLDCRITPFPDAKEPDLVCEIALSPGGAPRDPSPLVSHIGQRVTNRKLAGRTPLVGDDGEALIAAAAAGDARLQLVTDPEALAEMGRILGGGDRIRFLSERMHGEMMSELRWSPEEEERSRTGIGLAQLELPIPDLAGVRLSRFWRNMHFLREIRGGRGLEKSSKEALASSSAMGLLTFPGIGPDSYFKGGRALQRVWLTSSARGLAFQPMAALGYLFTRVERGGGAGLDADEISTLRALRERFARVFALTPDHAEIMIFRLGHAGPPTARSLRRPVDDVLTFEG